MRAPRITQPPRRILVPVEDADLAIHRPRRAPVAVRVERNRLHQILVAVLQVQVKGLVVVVGGGLWDGGCHVLFGEKGPINRSKEVSSRCIYYFERLQ